jgi:hypothetical protein
MQWRANGGRTGSPPGVGHSDEDGEADVSFDSDDSGVHHLP